MILIAENIHQGIKIKVMELRSCPIKIGSWIGNTSWGYKEHIWSTGL